MYNIQQEVTYLIYIGTGGVQITEVMYLGSRINHTLHIRELSNITVVVRLSPVCSASPSY